MEKAQIQHQIRNYYILEFPCTETALDEIENHYELEDNHFFNIGVNRMGSPYWLNFKCVAG